MTTQFPTTPSVTLFDPLAELLGAGDGRFHYTFDDAIKLSGHACPTVAGAFLMTVHALKALYGDEMPRRGEIHITIPGPMDGLGGQYARHGLMGFGSDQTGKFTFQRTDNSESVTVSYDPSSIPPDPGMMPLLQQILQGDSEPSIRQKFQGMWRSRVINILADAGERSITVGACRN